jgi:hypothetical protein
MILKRYLHNVPQNESLAIRLCLHTFTHFSFPKVQNNFRLHLTPVDVYI